MSGKIYCEMVILEKDEEFTEEKRSTAHVGAWLDDGDIYLEIMDDNDKAVIISMAPELLVALIQKAHREAMSENQTCSECGEVELTPDGVGVKLLTASKKKTDGKTMAV